MMSDSTSSDHGQAESSSQSRPEVPSNPTTQQMDSWNKDALLQWIQQKEPALLSGEDLDKFIAAKISGKGFLRRAGDLDFFIKAGLPIGVSQDLALLGDEVKKG